MKEALTDMESDILQLLYSNPRGLLREQICEKLGLKWSSTFYSLDRLRKKNLVKKTAPITRPGKAGRPKTRWHIR